MIKKLIINLSKQINKHNYRYYILNKPIISNYEYDKLLKKLIKLEKKYNFIYKNSPIKQFNKNLLNKKFKVTKHYFKMFSIKNVYSKENMKIWKKKIDKKIGKKNNYICELKYDGIAMSLIYKYGKLKSAITRGDGKYGNEVINNILFINNIKKYIKKIKNIKIFNIKGEIVFSKKNFNIINKINKKKYSNPRNAANGTIHSKYYNKNIKYLDFIPYSIYTNDNNLNINNQLKSIKLIENLYFKYPKKSYKLCKSSKQIINYISYWEKNISIYPYPIDGIVIKINDLNIQKQFKYNNIFYKWCIAYKFKDKELITKVKKVKFNVGKSGIIVPVVYFKPIYINGTIIKKASLYNSNIYNKYNLSINDKIIIKKSGNIIPKIIKNININKNKNKKINFTLYCPSCNKLLKKKNNILICKNDKKCKKQIIEKIKHFISAMKIKINNNIINKLFDNNKLNNITDLYNLNKNDFLLIYVKSKVYIRILNEIKNSKKNNLNNFLFSLCIPSIGKYICKKIEKKYKNLYNLLKNIKKNNIKFLGKNIEKNIKKYFNKNSLIIKKFIKLGFKI
ncbi:NAD-dependent DNA ligase LigA [Candidatus Shikimatogenerans bostrichidophilus]|uniref:NAD-dependent DNA ligase LigA n=1 Tax=Candidatus Shikimatogenerans bostrichidophilus TaxID=2943807 RepID=UPI002966E6E1